MRIETLEDLFVEQIEDLYDAEQRLVKALPKMVDASTSGELRSAFDEHLQQTRGQVTRLEQIFADIGKKAKGKTCDAMKGMIDEGEDIIDDVKASPLRDAGLIAAGNRVEHYEIAGYGTARTMAQTLGFSRAVDLLQQTLNEEKQADKRLTQIAEQMVNQEALHTGTRTAR
jgi:ferritin-like metal-binding protein YciE